MFLKSKKLFVGLFAACFLISQLLVTSLVYANANSTETGRIAGEDRYQTAAAISQNGWKTADYAVLARGDNYADALCAGTLAMQYGGPILLTNPKSLNDVTLNEIKRLGVKHLVIVGGFGAVSQDIENKLKASGITDIQRIYGNNRYETSVKIAEKIDANTEVVLATGEDYPDALSVSAIAAKLGMPILLTPSNSIPPSVSGYIKEKAISKTYLIGGTSVISSAIQEKVPNPLRLSGNNRYDTNVAILKNFENILNFDNIYVAIGGGLKGMNLQML